MLRIIAILFFSLSLLQSCRKDETELIVTKTYLHIGHTRLGENPNIVPEAAIIDYSKYDMLWLGGDMAFQSSKNVETMEHLDSIFDLSNSDNLWSLGNHDYSDIDRISQYTGRPPYYATYKNGITFLVLDTQDTISNIEGDQLDFVNQVLDTLTYSKHLIVLHHQLIWLSGAPNLEMLADEISNGPLGDCAFCIQPNNFYQDIYPKLVATKEKGIEVLCIGGDIGKRVKSFEYLTEDGIYFLASGIEKNTTGNLGLVFKHNYTRQKLTWSFEPIEDL